MHISYRCLHLNKPLLSFRLLFYILPLTIYILTLLLTAFLYSSITNLLIAGLISSSSLATECETVNCTLFSEVPKITTEQILYISPTYVVAWLTTFAKLKSGMHGRTCTRPKLLMLLRIWCKPWNSHRRPLPTELSRQLGAQDWISQVLKLFRPSPFFSFNVECVFWFWVGRSEEEKNRKNKIGVWS